MGTMHDVVTNDNRSVAARLFRQEALAARAAGKLGPALISRNFRYTGYTMASGMVIILLLCYLTFGEISRTEVAHGYLSPPAGPAEVATDTSGTVLKLLVAEGDFVSIGTPIAILDTDKHTLSGSANEDIGKIVDSKIATIDLELTRRGESSRAKIEDLEIKLHHAEQELVQLGDALALAKQKESISKLRWDRSKDLLQRGFITQPATEDARMEVIDSASKVNDLERTRESFMQEVDSYRAQERVERLGFAGDKSNLERSRLALQQDRTESDVRRTTIIASSIRGRVTAINATVGSLLIAGQHVATVVPGYPGDHDATGLQARLYLKSSAIGFVHTGTPVFLRYAAYPADKFGLGEGHVLAATQTPVSEADLPQTQAKGLVTASQSAEPLYRLDVSLEKQFILTYGSKSYLKPGMQVEANIILERRKLWEFMLDPIFAVIGEKQL